MVYRFTLISDEVDDFIREIKIDSEATFFDLHKAILDCTNFKDDQLTSFFLCDDDWEKEKEVTLEEMDNGPEEDSWVMKETPLNELIEDEKQKLLYVFDPLAERLFFIELSEIITGQDISTAVCSRKEGTPPPQTIDFEEVNIVNTNLDIDESFYGDQDFDLEDFDPEGFDFDSNGASFSMDEE